MHPDIHRGTIVHRPPWQTIKNTWQLINLELPERFFVYVRSDMQ